MPSTGTAEQYVISYSRNTAVTLDTDSGAKLEIVGVTSTDSTTLKLWAAELRPKSLT